MFNTKDRAAPTHTCKATSKKSIFLSFRSISLGENSVPAIVDRLFQDHKKRQNQKSMISQEMKRSVQMAEQVKIEADK